MNLPPKLAALAAAQGGAFTAAQAIAAGYNGDEIARLRRRGAWIRVRHGVYIERHLFPDDETARHLLQFRAALLTLKGPLAASHVTAVALHGAAMLEPDFSLVHVTREAAGTSRTCAGICHHNAALPAGHLTKIDELLSTSAARTIVDFARYSTFEKALVAAESALNKGVLTLAELREVLEYCADWPGARNAARVASFASPYSESVGETLGRIAFDELGVPQPDQQVLIFDERGFIARADYYWKRYHTIGEFDGKLKYTDSEAVVKEKIREDRARDTGLESFRFGFREAITKAPSIRDKAYAAYNRAEHSTAKRTYRVKYQPPPR